VVIAPFGRHLLLVPNRSRKTADYFAMVCGALALLSYFVLKIDAVTVAALVAGFLALIWAYVLP
jgi:hypothetical protein